MQQRSVSTKSYRCHALIGGFVLLAVVVRPAPLMAQEPWSRNRPQQQTGAQSPGLIGGLDFAWPESPEKNRQYLLQATGAAYNIVAEAEQVKIDPQNQSESIDAKASTYPSIATYPSVIVPAEEFPTVPAGNSPLFDTPLPVEAVEPKTDQTLWWNEGVGRPQLDTGAAIGLTLDQLFELAALHSARVQAISQQPLIAQTQIEQARAAFDPRLFSNNRFDSTSDPAESTLATGGPPRLEDNILGLEGGLQGQLRSGATYTLAQRFGLKTSNSTFFEPFEQGNSKLRANLGYPLLRGRRIDMPRSLVLTATFESHAARAEFAKEFQAHLYAISNTYWRLYQERAALLQRQRHLVRATEIAERIEQRSVYDIQQSQAARVKAAIANRRAELANVEANIRNLESQLRAQVNAPEIIADRRRELLPIQEPQVYPISMDMEAEVNRALLSRPELAEFQHNLQATYIRLQLAKDQLKPQLNLVSEAYLAGLREDFDTGAAFIDSFGDRPGYAAGLQFEQPYRQRAARQAVNQRNYEIAQLTQLLREAEENVRAEVESAIRDLAAAEVTALARYESVQAALADLDVQYDRWIHLGDDPRLGQVQLNELLVAQDRLLQEETSLLEATIQFNLAYLQMLRATGALVVLNQ